MRAPVRQEGFRIGPVTILTLVIVISLATLSVLAFTTARAAYTVAQKQDASIQSLYANERAAQEMIEGVARVLATHKDAPADPVDVAAELEKELAEATAQDDVVSATFVDGARSLEVSLQIREDMTYQVTRWSTDTITDTDHEVGLWVPDDAG